jgi:hypothetical protein
MPSFRADIRQWPTVADFAAHLARHDPAVCAWVQKIVIHHTVIPLPHQWIGLAKMRGLRNYYRGLGWDSGPHLFVCAGARDPDDDGIFQLTAMSERAVHANACNPDGLGIEVVGRYDAAPWPPPVEQLVVGVVRALRQWQRRPVAIVGHRDCGSKKSCPGRAIDLDRLRRLV